jgi:dUTP pyrophosphatase
MFIPLYIMSSPHYLLRLNLSDSVSQDVRSLYESAAVKHNDLCNSEFFDAGFDLFCPSDLDVLAKTTVKINQEVKGEMRFVTFSDYGSGSGSGMCVGYYMYPRSSTGTKTPLRLSNSVGIIDSGYRGHYISVFDNISEQTFKVERGQRLVQICPPNMTYPMRVEIVANENDLTMNTLRGEGGFGSTGK